MEVAHRGVDMAADVIKLAAVLEEIAERHGAAALGAADLTGIAIPPLAAPPGLNRAISFILAMEPEVMAGLTKGPTREYSRLYRATNERINSLSAELARALTSAGHRAWPVPASVRSDPDNIRGDFPHKTAATRSGLGWVGRHCQLVTFKLGPWLRLGTVLTDASLETGSPMEKSFCGECRACVDACPSGALSGNAWAPGVEREHILNARACDDYKKIHFMDFEGGRNCGICTAACPFGHKLLPQATVQA